MSRLFKHDEEMSAIINFFSYSLITIGNDWRKNRDRLWKEMFFFNWLLCKRYSQTLANDHIWNATYCINDHCFGLQFFMTKKLEQKQQQPLSGVDLYLEYWLKLDC